MTVYQAFAVHAPKSKTKKAMTQYAKAIVQLANDNIERYTDRYNVQPNTLLVSHHADLELIESWFGQVMHVASHNMPSGMFGVTRR